MKQQVSPVVAGIALIVVIGIAVLAWIKFGSSGAGSQEGEKPPGMPPDVAAEFQRRMGTATAPGSTAPPSGRIGGPPGGTMPGAGGYIAPPSQR